MTQSQTWLFLILTLLIVLMVYLLQPILGPFLLGIGIAYMADPFADRLEARGHSRTLAVVLVFFSFCVGIGNGSAGFSAYVF